MSAQSNADDSSWLAGWIREFYTLTLNETGQSIIVTVSLALFGAIILKSTYRLIETDWPEVYTDTETRVAEGLRTKPISGYLLFRGSPIFLVSTFVSVSLDRTDGSAWWGFWLMISVYLISTTGRVALNVYRNRRHPNWVVLLIYHFFGAAVVILFGVLGVMLRSLFSPVIPIGRELLVSVWAGLSAATIALLVRQLFSPRERNVATAIEKLKRDVGRQAWSHIEGLGHKSEILKNFIFAVVLAEVQQRPRWF